VAAAYDEIRAALRRLRGARVQVQAMVRGGREVILGSFKDPAFGTILMFGLGGIFVEYLKDVSFGLHPLHRAEAERMIRSLRGYPLLSGARGQDPVAFEVLVEALLRVSQLVGDFPQIDQVDVNPFIACPAPEPSLAVDVRVRATVTPGKG
jgi:acetyltransferase